MQTETIEAKALTMGNMRSRIVEALKSGPKSNKQLSDELGIKYQRVANCLSQLKAYQHVVAHGHPYFTFALSATAAEIASDLVLTYAGREAIAQRVEPSRMEPEDRLLVAGSAEALAAAQRSLIEQTGHKIVLAIDEARLAAQMVDEMSRANLAPTAAKALHKRATERVTFLVKVKDALEAGYCMMPDMPGRVIAVRTTADYPRSEHKKWSERFAAPTMNADKSLSSGEGDYKSPTPDVEREVRLVERGYRNPDGTVHKDKEWFTRAVRLKDPDGIDRKFVRPEIVHRMSQAMALKIFDEVVCVDDSDNRTRRKSKDPIVLGRVVIGTKACAFLIAWFVDPREL